jgi:hypothetical protein
VSARDRDHRAGDGAHLPDDDRHVIRNAVIHIANEQPLLADLFAIPTTTDVSLVCTNIRLLDGKKPVFIDDPSSIFVFPYLHVRFIEVKGAAGEGLQEASTDNGSAAAVAIESAAEADVDLELDEDFLRRIRDV